MKQLLIIIASTRPGRAGGKIGRWVAATAGEFPQLDVRVADLRDLSLPLLDEPGHPRHGKYKHPHTLNWSRTVEAADAFILVFPEYNHSYSAPLKNALDYLYREWAGKPVGLVSYGGQAGGARAAVALEPVLSNLGLDLVRSRVEISRVGEYLTSGGFAAPESHSTGLRRQLAAIQEQLASGPGRFPAMEPAAGS